MTEVSQEVFRSVYRKRDTFLHRSSYMRRGKTYAIKAGLSECGKELSGKRIFDFGFGPGNFLLSCPLDCHLSGCEIDPVHVEALSEELKARGQLSASLRVASDESTDYAAPFEGEKYDVIVLSHVLEHIPKPEEVLREARRALSDDGVIVVVLPLNEKRPDPKHFHEVTTEMARSWFEMAELGILVCREHGCVDYLIQPLIGKQSKLGRIVAQATGVSLGLLSGLFSPRFWWRCSDVLPTKPGQLVLVAHDGPGAGSNAPGHN